jgi:hypothetical protein
MRSGVVGMDDQFSTRYTNFFTSPLREWLKYFVLTMTVVEFAPIGKNTYYLGSRVIPDDVDH